MVRNLVSCQDVELPMPFYLETVFIQEKYLAKEKNFYFIFLDFEKAFDRVPWEVIWWILRKTRLRRVVG